MLALGTVQEGFETDGSPLDWSADKPASGCCSSPASKGGCCFPLGAKVVTNHLNQWLPGSYIWPMGTTWEVSSPPWLQGRCPQWEAAAPISQGWIILEHSIFSQLKAWFPGDPVLDWLFLPFHSVSTLPQIYYFLTSSLQKMLPPTAGVSLMSRHWSMSKTACCFSTFLLRPKVASFLISLI